MSYGATPGVDRLNTIAVDYDSFGRRREDGVRVSTRAIACAIVVACAAALGAHEVGRSTGTRLGSDCARASVAATRTVRASVRRRRR